MKRIHRRFAVAGMLLCCAGAIAQSAGRGEAQVDENRAEFGILISQKVLNGFLDQFVQRMERQYDLSPEQIAELQQLFRERVPTFLRENQKEATQLINEFLDTWNQPDAPTPEYVAEWARRALPMLEKARVFLGETSEAMKDHLSDEQVVKLDATMAAIEVGVTMSGKRLQEWAAGRYDPETEWHRNPRARMADRERERQARQAMEDARLAKLREYGVEPDAPAAPASPTVNSRADASPRGPETAAPPKQRPKDEWARYVDAFIARYELDSEQQQKAQLFLNEAYQQREKYLSSKAAQMAQIEKKFHESKDKDDLAAAEARYQELLKPTERTFERLKEKLDTLPRRDQRARAAARDEAADSSAKPVAEVERAQNP